jgi:hypothetical protein
MLAEVRAYGEGIAVVEQIPTKLTPEILKNTNLKIVHRLVAEDERRKVGGCMNMSENQMRHLSTLCCGHAAVFAEGCQSAYLIQVPNHLCQQKAQQTYIDKEMLMQHMHDKIPTSQSHHRLGERPGLQAGRDPKLPECPGCEQSNCAIQRTVTEHLLDVDHANEFAKAIEAGWDALWAFGERCAREIWLGGDSPADASYCVLMNIAGLAGYDDETCRKLRRNLMLFCEQGKERRR